MKLLRPLHRRRVRRRNRMTVLDSKGLLEHFKARGVALSGEKELSGYLQRHNIPFHRDGQGEIWVSIEQDS